MDSDEMLRAAEAFAEAGKNGAAILAATRAAGAGGAPDALRTLVNTHAAPLAIGQRVERFQQALAVVETVKGFRADAAEVAAAVLDGVLAGGEPVFRLRALAQYLNQVNANTVALDVVRGAIALDPGPGRAPTWAPSPSRSTSGRPANLPPSRSWVAPTRCRCAASTRWSRPSG